jgi:hypothetical protein
MYSEELAAKAALAAALPAARDRVVLTAALSAWTTQAHRPRRLARARSR